MLLARTVLLTIVGLTSIALNRTMARTIFRHLSEPVWLTSHLSSSTLVSACTSPKYPKNVFVLWRTVHKDWYGRVFNQTFAPLTKQIHLCTENIHGANKCKEPPAKTYCGIDGNFRIILRNTNQHSVTTHKCSEPLYIMTIDASGVNKGLTSVQLPAQVQSSNGYRCTTQSHFLQIFEGSYSTFGVVFHETATQSNYRGSTSRRTYVFTALFNVSNDYKVIEFSYKLIPKPTYYSSYNPDPGLITVSYDMRKLFYISKSSSCSSGSPCALVMLPLFHLGSQSISYCLDSCPQTLTVVPGYSKVLLANATTYRIVSERVHFSPVHFFGHTRVSSGWTPWCAKRGICVFSFSMGGIKVNIPLNVTKPSFQDGQTCQFFDCAAEYPNLPFYYSSVLTREKNNSAYFLIAGGQVANVVKFGLVSSVQKQTTTTSSLTSTLRPSKPPIDVPLTTTVTVKPMTSFSTNTKPPTKPPTTSTTNKLSTSRVKNITKTKLTSGRHVKPSNSKPAHVDTKTNNSVLIVLVVVLGVLLCLSILCGIFLFYRLKHSRFQQVLAEELEGAPVRDTGLPMMR